MPTPTHTVTFPRYLVVGFVGTRRIPPEREAAVKDRLRAVLNKLQGELPNGARLAAISALAQGADTLFAEVVAERAGVPHQVFLPHTEDEFFNLADFGTEAALQRARARLTAADGNVVEVRVVSLLADRRERFAECGFEIVSECDVLLAVVEDDAAERRGGTTESLRRADALGRRIFRVAMDPGLMVTETAGGASAAEALPEDEVFRWELPVDPDELDPHAALLMALKERASVISRRQKQSFANVAGTAVWTHVAATAVAALAIVLPATQGWAKVLKPLLLLAGFGVPLYFHQARARPERRWVTGRLVAELTRSVLAVRGLPGQLSYLRNFVLPGFAGLMRSLNLVRLQSARRRPVSVEEFAHTYLVDRIGELQARERSVTTQLAYFYDQAAEADRRRRWLEGGFYFFSAVALACVIVYPLFFDPTLASPDWERVLFWFVPIAFPTAAAACAGWISIMDFDRRVERYRQLLAFLSQQRERIRNAAGRGMLVRTVHRTEQALLQEIVEWHAKHTHVRSH